jgi:hypothetical protein
VGGESPLPLSFTTHMQIIKDLLLTIAIVALAWITTVAFFCL